MSSASKATRAAATAVCSSRRTLLPPLAAMGACWSGGDGHTSCNSGSLLLGASSPQHAREHSTMFVPVVVWPLASSLPASRKGHGPSRGVGPLRAKSKSGGAGSATAGKGFGAVKPAKPAPPPPAPDAACACGSGKPYNDCCAPYHRGAAVAASPEALLRSRYSAYVLKDAEYIADTTHPDSREHPGRSLRARYVSEVKDTMKQLNPLKLQVLSHSPGQANGSSKVGSEFSEEHFISFRVTRSLTQLTGPLKGKRGPPQEVTERSQFVREAASGRWYYLDSQFVDESGTVVSAPPLPPPSGREEGGAGRWY